MERISLTAETRVPGKGAAGRMRKDGNVPAILYGKSVKPLAISVNKRELEKAVKTKSGMNVIVDLKVSGGESGLALIRDFQADPFKRDFLHVDFQAISLTEKLDVEVPVVLTGESVGVKEGGIVEQLRRSVQIRALPTSIPDKIEVSISELKIGDSIHANEMKLPEGAEFAQAFNYTIVAIVPPAKEEVVAAPVAAIAEGEAATAEGAAAPAEGAAAAAAPAGAPGAAPAAKGAAAPAKGAAPAAKPAART